MTRILGAFFLAVSLAASPSLAADFKVDAEFARHFAAEWIDSWNAHDLPRILAHYTDDAQMSSPYIIARGVDPSGRVTGKSALAKYWGPAVDAKSTLKFELQNVLVGVDSISISYHSNLGGGRSAVEVFHFNDKGLVTRAFAHYADLPKK